MELKINIKSWTVGLGILGALSVSASSMALDLPECKGGEYLWLVTAGNPSGTLMPKADMRVSTVTFQDWTDGKKTLRTAAFTNVPTGQLGAAKTFERYKGGGNLGWFAKSWPTPVEGYEIKNFKPLPPRNPAPSSPGGEYPTDFASSNLTDGLQGETLAQVLSGTSFDGKLTYIAPAEARIDFVTIALCTSAVPTSSVTVEANTTIVTVPATSQMTETQIAARIEALRGNDTENELAQTRLIKERLDAAETAVKTAAEAAKQAELSAIAAKTKMSDAAKKFQAEARNAANLAEKAFEKAKNAQAYLKANPAQQAAPTALDATQKAAQDAVVQKLIALKAAKAAEQADEETAKVPIITAPEIIDLPVTEADEPAAILDEKLPVIVEQAIVKEEKTPVTKYKKEAIVSNPPTLKSEIIAIQTKSDIITSGGMATAAVVSTLANMIGNMLSASRTTIPTPSPIPQPAPTPTPGPSQASTSGRRRKKEKDEKIFNELPQVQTPSSNIVSATIPATPPPSFVPPAAPKIANPNKPSSSLPALQNSAKGVLFPNSLSYTGQIPNASAAVANAYAAVGRMGYPHAPRAARDAMDLGFGSAVLIAPNKILTNYHVWHIIKDMPGIGVEFEAREGNEISEFITLESKTPEILEGLDAVVLTLSRKIGRTPIWPKDVNYAEEDLEGRQVYAIGHPIKPEDESWLMKNAIEEVFNSANPFWNIKRYSAGPIVRHALDTDREILLEVPVREAINATSLTPALCHRASTIGGNSGGAIICAESGDFLGLHFGGQYWKDEDINYAVPSSLLLAGLNNLKLNTLGSIKSSEAVKDETSGPSTLSPATMPKQIKDAIPAKSLAATSDMFESVPQIDTSNDAPNDAPTLEDNHNYINEQSLTEYIASRSPDGEGQTAVHVNAPDDLTRIEGIGPKTEQALKEAGISTFKMLSQGSPYDLLPILEAAGLPRRDPTTWPAQAALAANGDWEKLEAWQDLLHGGRETT